jgi:hypothetical protein
MGKRKRKIRTEKVVTLSHPWLAMHQMILFVEANKELFDVWDNEGQEDKITPEQSAVAITSLHSWIHRNLQEELLGRIDNPPVHIPATQLADAIERLVKDAQNYVPGDADDTPTGMYL